MDKKQILKFGVVAMFVVLVAYVVLFFAPVKQEGGQISFDVTLDAVENDVLQIYYLIDETDDFKEENSISFVLEAGKPTSVQFDIKEIDVFRVDFGTKVGNVQVDNLKFSMGMFSSKWTEDDWNSMKGIMGIQNAVFTENTVNLYSNSEDPYIIWDIEDLQIDGKFATQINVFKNIIKMLFC